MSARTKKLSDADYTRLADFRYALRCFLEFSEIAVAKEGLTPQQHQALLVIRASPQGTANIGRSGGKAENPPQHGGRTREPSGIVRV